MTGHVKREPCPTLLRILINYDPLTGSMIWNKRGSWTSRATKNNHDPKEVTQRFNDRYAGKPAISSKKGNGYLYGNIKGKNLLAHRVAWCISHGKWPKNTVDHINGNRSDNRMTNLRDVSVAANSRNRFDKPANGQFGITFDKKNKKWSARIMHGGRNVHLGYFDQQADAAKARKQAEERFWGNEK